MKSSQMKLWGPIIKYRSPMIIIYEKRRKTYFVRFQSRTHFIVPAHPPEAYAIDFT